MTQSDGTTSCGTGRTMQEYLVGVVCVCVGVVCGVVVCCVLCAHVCVCVRVCGVCCVLCIVFQGGWAGCGTSLNESGKIPKPCPFGSGRGLWPWILTELGTLAGEWDPEVSQGYPRGIREVSQKYPRGIPVDIPSIAPEKPECVLVGHVSVSGCVFASVARLSAQLSFIVNSQEHEQTNTHTHTHTHALTKESKTTIRRAVGPTINVKAKTKAVAASPRRKGQ